MDSLPKNHEQDRRADVFPLLVCAIVFATIDFLIGPLSLAAGPSNLAAMLLMFACTGALVAQMGLHAIWVVLAPVAGRIRIAVATAVGLVWFSAWALGYAINIAASYYPHSDFLLTATVIILCLPLVSIGIQLPLWLARYLTCWRIRYLPHISAELGRDNFGMRHLFIGTTVVVIALAAARLAESITPRGNVMIPTAITAVVSAIISSVTILPMVAANLSARRTWLSLPVTLLLNVMVGFAYIMFLVVFVDSAVALPPEVFAMLASLICGFFVSVTATLLMVRGLGYRLFTGAPEG